MSLELTAIPLAFLAGMLGVLSPCVWPLVPIVMGSASGQSRFGPYALALGLSLAFAVAGTLLSFVLVNLGLDPELFRYFAALLLLLVGLVLVVKPLGDWLSLRLSMLSSRFSGIADNAWGGQFGVGFLLGIVWLPCVGPTLGAAIALASQGQQMTKAFIIMLAFGVGTALVLLVAGLVSGKALQKLTGGMSKGAGFGKIMLGAMLILLGLLTLTGLDKQLEAWALGWLPEWVFGL
ncbi:cytochrome c biogenesis CcdA family protein [Gilvimarinus sp. SDUM040013]|uniref:Cytochrome c biogenesis CcdA family protein n=1 Tax=Gilvimarinus gilvus TaxID=3058038 RepID=A0ABU4S1S9_9GAMM|nr:cytochrome c biogenesis CcdA family protein [Gilvimarinus sp. SDUM040013]MDO3385847.1 cytochrome c biogenesis CcdA family protein [Gilvimarinus sp. SDUM040013]MDX6851140.1 cytochrome c biogenesis CcdA family protein [Gilvimarinus sp. SDUM040013]